MRSLKSNNKIIEWRRMVYNDKQFIAQKIRLFRKKAGLTQSELGEKIGITDKHICKIETGMYAPSVETFLKLVDVLNIDLQEFGINKAIQNNNFQRESFIKLLYSLDNKKIDLLYSNAKNLLEILTKYEKNT
jgi:DNA-binding XRE family transcriptional regulator